MTLSESRSREPRSRDSQSPEHRPLLEVENLIQRFRIRGGTLEAVSDVSFTIGRAESLGLVGESGSGKTTTGRAVVQLPRPTAGSVRLEGTELTALGHRDLKPLRHKLQMIFQDPASAMNPRRSIRDIVAEGLVIAGQSKSTLRQRVDDMLGQVGLDASVVGSLRAQDLSGGQRQRVAIARALVVEPRLLVCDEPVASLDVSVQGQVLNVLEQLRRRLGLSMLFISHDLAVVHAVSDRIAVMYLGKLVELASADAVTRTPAHPYTRALLDSVPVADPTAQAPPPRLAGEIPSAMSPPSGCRFRTRCPLAQKRCALEAPAFRPIADAHLVACHFPLHGQTAPPRQDSDAENIGSAM
jgi:peptide/nickel transport system ATP-binding protein